MYAKRFVIGLILLIILGGILTAVFHMTGGLGTSAPAAIQALPIIIG